MQNGLTAGVQKFFKIMQATWKTENDKKQACTEDPQT